MDYFNLYTFLEQKMRNDSTRKEIDETIEVADEWFVSNHCDLLQGNPSVFCRQHQISFEDDAFQNPLNYSTVGLDVVDCDIHENKQFKIHIFIPKEQRNESEAIILLHGFNEKTWNKYYPWAYELAKRTHQSVILFPIAFHMNRAPQTWSDKRIMFNLSHERDQTLPYNRCSSFSNAAISTRMHNKPQRFIWSGLQTYYDVVQFVKLCHAGHYRSLTTIRQFHFFSYSIGTFLAEILKISNPDGHFTHSKLCAFCGGATFNRFSPVSKPILDSEANIALYAFLIENLEKHLLYEKKLYHFLEEHREGQIFRMMLNHHYLRVERERFFRLNHADIFAITLEKDSVIPSYEIYSTLKGAYHDIPTNVKVTDFDYDYTHETPFPLRNRDRDKINAAFEETFRQFTDFLLGNQTE
ncbi:MAG: DUF6051 family protein [Microbacter sp.]